MKKVVHTLHSVANASSSIYRIVFTGLLLFELVRYQLRRKRNAANLSYRDLDRGR